MAHQYQELNPATEKLVDDFTAAMKTKLAKAEQKYGYSDNWRTDDWEADCQRDLARHVQKGGPLGVAAYAAFCWARGYRTAPEQAGAVPAGWKLVPVKGTREMHDAFYRANGSAEASWYAMLSAAPTPPDAGSGSDGAGERV